MVAALTGKNQPTKQTWKLWQVGEWLNPRGWGTTAVPLVGWHSNWGGLVLFFQLYASMGRSILLRPGTFLFICLGWTHVIPLWCKVPLTVVTGSPLPFLFLSPSPSLAYDGLIPEHGTMMKNKSLESFQALERNCLLGSDAHLLPSACSMCEINSQFSGMPQPA